MTRTDAVKTLMLKNLGATLTELVNRYNVTGSRNTLRQIAAVRAEIAELA